MVPGMHPAPPKSEVWLVTGAQHLYGPGPLEQVATHSRKIARALTGAPAVPYPVAFRPVMTTADSIRALCLEANQSPQCAGLVLWMHTFSPAKMWIAGLSLLRKPFAHLHTQFNRDLPWAEIDMDFMNLNQSAHGDREAGFLHARMRLPRKVIVGHWEDPEVQERLGAWMRVARAWHGLQGARFARLGDNMRNVAVTEGDKVAAEVRLGFSVAAHGVGDLVAEVAAAPEARVTRLCAEYADAYSLSKELGKGGSRHASLREAARIELGLRAFLEKGGYSGFTTNFEDLHGLRQLPGLAVQRLMARGYGFGAEGDWKTCALLWFMKAVGVGLPGGTSFMEDYTYHLDPRKILVLGAHMLEVCESIASAKPSLELHPLGIGAREDPPRLVFSAGPGPAINASLVDLGNRFRLVVNEVDAVEPPEALPRLPVARAVWTCRPDFKTACGAWIRAGGAHHTGFSYPVTAEHMRDFAEMSGIELLVIDADTRLREFEKELRWNEAAYQGPPGQRG
jgi:L-arabinose isomerase